MWGKFAIAFICWIATLGGVTKVIHSLPPRPGGGFLYHDSVTMILVGGFFLITAMTIKKIYAFFGVPASDLRLVDHLRRRQPSALKEVPFA